MKCAAACTYSHGSTPKPTTVPPSRISSLAPHATLDDALKRYFNGDAHEIQLTPIANWQTEVGTVLKKWLVAYRDSVLPSAFGTAGDGKSQDELVDNLVDLFQVALQPRVAWKVDINLDIFYELVWDDIVFACASGTYFLHLGMSD